MNQLFSIELAVGSGQVTHISKLYVPYLFPPSIFENLHNLHLKKGGFPPSAFALPSSSPDTHLSRFWLQVSLQDLKCLPSEHCSGFWKIHLPSMEGLENPYVMMVQLRRPRPHSTAT